MRAAVDFVNPTLPAQQVPQQPCVISVQSQAKRRPRMRTTST